MRPTLWSVWKNAIIFTVCSIFGHEYGCCGKFWKRCKRCSVYLKGEEP